MPRHRFSPILETEVFTEVLEYLVAQGSALVQVVTGRALAVDMLGIFAHSPEEYAFLAKMAHTYGPESKYSHGLTLSIKTDFTVADQHIRHLNVRQPDTSRPEVGYADYPATYYDSIKAAHPRCVREITSGRGAALLELRHPDFDILGFIYRKGEYDD